MMRIVGHVDVLSLVSPVYFLDLRWCFQNVWLLKATLYAIRLLLFSCIVYGLLGYVWDFSQGASYS